LKFKVETVLYAFLTADSPKQFQKRRHFLLAYRRHYPAHSRHPKSVKKDIQLSLSFDIFLLYTTEQMFVNTS